MVSLRSSGPTHPLLGLGLVALLAGIFYVGSTLPTSEPAPKAEEQAATEEPVAREAPKEIDSASGADDAPPLQAEQSPRTFETALPEALDRLDSLDSLDDDGPLLRIFKEDPERFFGGPCEAWVTEAPSE
jgi:hypothetical protein